MKLRTKLFLSFAVVILLVGGIGFTSSYINESVKDQVTAESKSAIKEIELAGEMGLQLFQSLTKTQYLLEAQYRQSLPTDFSQRGMANEVVIKNIDKSLQNFRQSLKETRQLIKEDHDTFYSEKADTSNVLGLLDQLEKKFGIYSSLVEELKQLSATSYSDAKEFFTVTVEPYFRTNLLPLIEKVRIAMQQNHQKSIAGLNTELDRVGRILGVATIFALLIAITITFFLYRSIANPINKLAKAAKSIAQGNLEERIDYNSNDELGQLSRTFNNMAESLSRTTVSRDYVDSIIESMADLLIVVDRDYNITRINSAGLSMLQKQEEELLGRSVYDIFDQGGGSLLETNNDSSEDTIKNAALIIDNEEKIPVNISVGSLQDRDGDPEGYVIVASDISSEKEAQARIKQSLKEKEVLLAEIHHRVKNNLAVISGLLQMQVWEAENESAINALQQSQFRIRSIAMVHEKLYQSEDLSHIEFDQYIHELLEAIKGTFLNEDADISIQTDLEQLTLNINQAIPCSLLLNELIVNAFKHAFPEGEEGTINIAMQKTGSEVNIKVKDNGVGFPENLEAKKSLGMQLVETLSEQISAEIEFENNAGAEVSIYFQAEEV